VVESIDTLIAGTTCGLLNSQSQKVRQT